MRCVVERLVVLLLRGERLGEVGRDGREVALLADRLEGREPGAELALGRGGIAGEELDRAGVRAPAAVEHHQAALLQDRVALRRELASVVEAALHRDEVREDRGKHRLERAVAASLLPEAVTALDRRDGRGRADERRPAERGQEEEHTAAVAGALGVDESLVQRRFHVGDPALDEVGMRAQVGRLGRAGIVAELGEDAGCPVGELVELADVALARVDAEEAALDQRVELEPDVAGRRRAPHDVLEQLARSGRAGRCPSARRRARAAVRARRSRVGAGSATARSSRLTAAGPSPRASERRPAPVSRAAASSASSRSAAPELAPVARRLLEVVADELVLLLALVEPARQPLVQIAPKLLR